MRWYFKENGSHSSTVFKTPPSSDSDREKLIDVVQDWMTEWYIDVNKVWHSETKIWCNRIDGGCQGCSNES